MITPRWRKIFIDLWGNKVRTLLVALSIAVGVFAVGVVGGSYFIMSTDISADFLAANPRAASIFTSHFDDDTLASLRRVEGVGQLEGRSSTSGQVILKTGQKAFISLQTVRSVDDRQIDRLRLEAGSPTLRDKEIYLDRGSLAAGYQLDDTIQIERGDGQIREVRVVGIVHDVSANAFSITNQLTAYANPDTIELLGGTPYYSSVMLTTAENGTDEAHVREVADRVSDKIKKSGREVFVTVVMRPGQHPVQQMIDSLLALLGGMGVLSVFLSTFLVINTISGLLNQQIRQIGVMKAVGADMFQIMGMYLVLILLFGIVALILAVPLAGVVSYLMAYGIVQLVNSNIGSFRIPTEVLIMEVFVGLVVPLVAGFVPVLGGARLTVREAISNYGLSTGGNRSFFDRILESVRGLPRPLLISLRNTFRRKGRLVLTLSTLILGGAIFMGVVNVRSSLYASLDKTFGYFLSDVNIDFNRGYRMERINNVMDDLPGITSVEGWAISNAQVLNADGATGTDVIVWAPPAGSQMVKPVLTSGRWLLPEDQNAVVIGNHLIKLRPELKVGDTVQIQINNKKSPFVVVGIYSMAGTVIPPFVYSNAEALWQVQSEAGMVYSIRVVTEQHDAAAQRQVAKSLESRFNAEGIGVSAIQTGTEIIQGQRFLVDIIIYLLLFMAILIAVVGGLGLMGTMSMNVLERTREIGVMRSIGAVDGAIFQLVILEGMVIGTISWGFGALLSVPITNALNTLVGVSMLNVPLDFFFAVEGLVLWLAIVMIISAVASMLPARNAVRLTVRDVLAYE